MLRIFFLIILLFVLAEASSYPSWILKQTRQMQRELLQFHAINNDSLLIQTEDSIYIAPSNNPSFVQQGLVSSLKQRIPIAFDQQSSTYLFFDFQYLQYGQPNSSEKHTLENTTSTVNIVKIKDIIYYIQPTVCPYLMLYNLTSKKTTKGPDLVDTAKIFYDSVIAVNSLQTQIHIAIGTRLFIISVETLKILQIFHHAQHFGSIQLIDTASLNFFVQATQFFNKIYKYDNITNKTTLIHTLSISDSFQHRLGYVCDDSSEICKITQFFIQPSGITVKTSDINSSEPYDQVIDSLNAYYKYMHTISDDKSSVYSLEKLSRNWLIKHKITNQGLEMVENRSFTAQIGLQNCRMFRIWKDELTVLQDTILLLVDLQSNVEKCKKQISDFQALVDPIRQIFFNYKGDEMFITMLNNKNRLIWINLGNCEIKTKDFDFDVLSILFWSERIFAFLIDPKQNLIELDTSTKEIIHKFSTQVSKGIIFKQNLFGIVEEEGSYTLVKLDINIQIISQYQLGCLSPSIMLKAGRDHLSAICNNQYYIFDENLQYLGSTQVDVPEPSIYSIQQTASPLLRFDRNHGELHLNILKKWNTTFWKQHNLPHIRSNLYFYNQTDAVYISKGSEQYYLNHVSLQGLKINIKYQERTNIYTNDGIMYSSFFRWSADKSYILIHYSSESDQFHAYQNVYTFPSLKLVYSHRSGVEEFTAHLVAFIDRNNTLTISKDEGLQMVDLKKRKTTAFPNLSTGQLSFSSDGEQLLIIGQNVNKQQSIGVVYKFTGEAIQKQSQTIYKPGSKLYAIQEKLFVLSENSLYQHQPVKSTLVQDNIADCTYLNKQSIICLKVNNDLLLINQTHSALKANTPFASSYQKIKAYQEHLLVYNTHSFAIFSAETPFNLIQTINFNQRSTDLATISPDSEVITYDKQKKSLSYWSKGECPSLTQLNEGICECIQDQVGGVCKCRKGHFESQGKCLECSFYCSECSGGAGGCQALSAGGVLMIVGLALLPVLAGVGICCYLRRRRARVSKAQAMSELLEQRSSSINDD